MNLWAIPVLASRGGPRCTTSALQGEQEDKNNQGILQALTHPGRHERHRLDLQKPAGKKAHADPPCGYNPNGLSNCPNSCRCGRQA